MKVSNMQSRKGNKVSNQFIINESDGYEYFQSYNNIICKRTKYDAGIKNELDEYYWNYSRTTSKYLSMFLNESTADIKKKIKSGEYLLANLNP